VPIDTYPDTLASIYGMGRKAEVRYAWSNDRVAARRRARNGADAAD